MKKNCKNCQGKCSDCAERQAKEFELEVDEEIQQERLSQFWKKYSWLIYSLVFLILAGVVGYESYNTWWKKTRLTESDLFEKSVILAGNEHTEKAIAGFEELSLSGRTGYRILAQLELADIYMKNGEKEKAIALLKTAAKNTKASDPLHQVIVLSLVSYQLDDGQPDELLNTLKPVLDDANFQGLATELAVILLKKQNKLDEAKTLIQKALANSNITPNTKARLNNLLGE